MKLVFWWHHVRKRELQLQLSFLLWYFKRHAIQPAMLEGYVEMIYPDKPNHPKQKYRLTAKGIALKSSLTSNK